MPYERIGWPILSEGRRRIPKGRKPGRMTSDAIAAMTARKVMYWKTRMKPNSGEYACSHCERLSSMGVSRGLADERRDDALHAHEPRSLDQHRRVRRRRIQRRDQRLDRRKAARSRKRGHAVRAL